MSAQPLSAEDEAAAWEAHDVSQLQHFRSLSLREKLLAIEGMCDTVRRLQEMRDRGELAEGDPRTAGRR